MESAYKKGQRRIRVSIISCPRCGQEHLDKLFVEFGRNVLITDVLMFNFWAFCSKTREPLLAWANLDDEITEIL